MTIRYRERDGRGDIAIMTECPLCGHVFGDIGEGRAWHFLTEHGPEDV